MAVPNIFGTATAAIPLSQLDQNFATAITLGNTAVYLGNTTTSLGNVTLTNVTISSGTSNIAANVSTAVGLLPEAQGGTGTITGYYGFKNRIINGAMVIDQRNAGASVSINPSTAYAVDRFQSGIAQGSGHTAERSTSAPAGFINSLLVTVGTGASPSAANVSRVYQNIEGLNIADLNWGLATASTITLSFWVKSSLTGTFAGGIYNNAANRTYVFTYAISAANTWEQKSVTIAGDTSGTWLTNNSIGMTVNWDLGTGSTYQGTAGVWAAGAAWATSGSVKLAATSGANWSVTGVQLEKGSTATSFDYRPYGTELALCQRYFQKITWTDSILTTGQNTQTSAGGGAPVYFVQEMRASPTITLPTAGTSAGNATFLTASGGYPATIGTVVATAIRTNGFAISYSGYTSAFTAGYANGYYATGTATITMSSEL
jgi:hypothetical protein